MHYGECNSILYTQVSGRGSFHYHFADSSNMYTFDVPDNIIVKDFDIYGNKIVNFCGYIPGNPDRAVFGQFCVADIMPPTYTSVSFYYVVLPLIDGAPITRLNNLDCSKRFTQSTYNVVAVGEWNGTGHCVVELVPTSSILSTNVSWTMGYVTDRSTPEIFDDVAMTDNFFVTVSRVGTETYLRQFKISSFAISQIPINLSWRTSVIQIPNRPVSPFRIVGLANDSVIVAGLGNSPYPSQMQLYPVHSSDFGGTSASLSLYLYDSPCPPKDVRYSMQGHILYLLQEGYEKDWVGKDCIYSFYRNSSGGISTKAKYTQYKRIYSFGEYEYSVDRNLSVGQLLPDNIFLFGNNMLSPGHCSYEFEPIYSIDYPRPPINPVYQPCDTTSFQLTELLIQPYTTPINTICE